MGLKRNTLGYTLVLCCLLSLLLIQLSEGKRNNNNKKSNNRAGKAGKQARASRCKNKRTFLLTTSDLQRSPMTFKCAHGPVVSADVLGTKAKCRGTTGYTRWSASRCMWNQTCSLGFEKQVMDSLAPGVHNKTCLGQVPDKLEVGYTCLKKKVMVTDTLGTFKKTRRAAGIIRSHKLYPWSYRNGVELGNVTFNRPRKAGLTHLWISVYYYAILNADLVFLSWEEKAPAGARQTIRAMRQILPNDTTFSLPDVSSVILTFFADYRHHRSDLQGEEKGFLLCYQWLKAKGRPKKGTACSKVLMPAKCRSKRGSKKRKPSNPKSRRNNNRRARNNQRPSRSKTPRNSRPSRN